MSEVTAPESLLLLNGTISDEEPPQLLPRLRQDIDVLPAPREKNGAPSWTLFDPVRNLFFRIGWFEFEMLSRWEEGDVRSLVARMNRETRFEVEPANVEAFVRHLRDSELTANEPGYSWRKFTAVEKLRQSGPFKWMLHHYLFFRVPLIHPDRILESVERWSRFMFSRGFATLLLVALFIGLYLAGRQWDVLVARLHALTSLQMLPWFVVTLIFCKLFHELGHAIVAKRHGVRVPAVGVAFMVFWPMLYTDTTDAWRVTSRYARMAIDGAGVAAELVLAIVALFAWSFLPDGPLRDAALMVATVTWVTTLLINLSPLMRFDGYYLLADFVDIPNLQIRAFATTRWWIRRRFLGIEDSEPEPFAPARRRWMIVYSFTVWIYRLGLFIGIAVIVYHFFIKLVGILLFLVEISWFVLRPILRELRVWWIRRADMRITRNGMIALGVICVIVFAFLWPWTTRVQAPAVARASSFVRLFPTAPARIEQVNVDDGAIVSQGEVLFVLSSPDIDNRIAIARAKIEESEREMTASSYDQVAAERRGVLLGEIATRRREIASLEELRGRLILKAPMAGEIRNLPTDLRPGRWVGEDTLLGLLIDRRLATIVGYVAEEDVRRISSGAHASFYSNAPDAEAVKAKVVEVERVDVRALDDKDLATPRGGPIEVQRREQDGVKPIRALYKVRLAPDEAAPIDRATRGVVDIESEPQSIVYRFWRSSVAVAIRESGF